MEQWHTQVFAEKDKLNQTYIEWTVRVNETQVQTVSANDSGQRIMGNEVFDGVVEVWDGVPSSKAHGSPARDHDTMTWFNLLCIYINTHTFMYIFKKNMLCLYSIKYIYI